MREKKAHVFEKEKNSWYVEPVDCTAALLRVERFIGPVWDPCCGQGNVLRAFAQAGYSELQGSDIVRRIHYRGSLLRHIEWFRHDFLKDEPPFDHPPNIVCNPPFEGGKGAEAFIRRALEIAEGKVAMFVDWRFVTGARRASGLYRAHRPTRIWQISPRPSCPPGQYLRAGNKAQGGQADYCWIVWDLTAPSGDAVLGWIDRGEHDGELEEAA